MEALRLNNNEHVVDFGMWRSNNRLVTDILLMVDADKRCELLARIGRADAPRTEEAPGKQASA